MPSYQELLHDYGELKAKLDEAEETLRAIRNGEVDALIVSTAQGNEVYTLEGADQPYRVLIEEMHQGAITILVDGTILYSNRRFAETVSYPLEALLASSIYQHIMPEDRQKFTEFIQAAQSLANINGDFSLRNQQDEPIPVHISANALQFNQLLSLGLVVTDLRERKRAERGIAQLASIVTSSNDAIIGETLDAIITSWNRGAERIFGYSAVEVIHKPITILMPAENAGEETLLIQKVLAGETVENYDVTRLKKDGTAIFVSVSLSPIKDEQGNIVGVSKIAQDVTQRKRMEELLEQERRLMRTLIDSIPDRIYAKDTDGRFTLKNEADARQMGADSTTEVIGKTDFDYYPSSLAAQYSTDDQNVIQSGQSLINREELFLDVEGNSGWMLTTKVPLRDKTDKVIGLVGIGRDITDRKQAEVKLAKLNRTLSLISGVNQSIVRIRVISELFETVCHIAVKSGGFHMAWIGLLDSETRQVTPVAHGGVIKNYLEMLDIVLDDAPRGQGPTATALRTGEPVIVNDIENDPRMIPWRKDALQLGYRSSAALPLNFAGEIHAVLNLYANQTNFFDDEEIVLLGEMAADISFAMEFAEKEAQRQQALMALQQHVHTVEAMRLFLQTTLDAFPANTVVLDPSGSIINVNASWIRFADENNAPSPMHYLGTSYLTVCDTAAGDWSEEATAAAKGIRGVINGLQDEFYLEYPCHSPSEKRWFALRVTPFPEPAPHHVVVAHINITERKQAEAAVKLYAQRMEILHEIDTGIINATSIQEVVDTAIKHTHDIINCQQIGVALFDFTTNELNVFALDLNAPSMLATGNRYPIPPGYLEGFGANTVRVIDDIQLLSDANPTHTRLVQEGMRASLRVLLMFQGHPIGVFGLNADTPGFFTAEHQEIVVEIANQIAIAIKQLRLSEEVARHVAELEQRVVERTADLTTAKERVEAILNSSADAILLLKDDFSIQQTNASFNSLFACEQDDYLAKSLNTLLDVNDSDSMDRLLQAAAEHKRLAIDVAARRKDDTIFAAELSIGFIRDGSFVCTFHDISERKAQERQLRYHASLQQNVTDAVIVTDTEFHIQSWNRASERIYGWNAQEVVNKTTAEILRTGFSTDNLERNRQQLREQGWWQSEVIDYHKDGSLRHILASVTLVKDESGIPSGIVFVNHDITERKKVDEALHAKVEEERKFQHYLKELHEITIELTQIDRLDIFYKRVIEFGLKRLGFERMAMFLYDPKDDSALGTYGTDSQGKITDERHVRLAANPNAFMTRAFNQAERFTLLIRFPFILTPNPWGLAGMLPLLYGTASKIWAG
jgi:PAS domain S-box-containing protein